MSVVHNSDEYFWPTIFKEIEENYNILSSTDNLEMNLNSSVSYY